MSLKDLGKVKQVFDSFINNPLFAAGGKGNDVQKYAKSILGNMDIDKVISGFAQLGAKGDDLADMLKNCGFEADEVAEKMNNLGSTGGSYISGLGEAFAGLAARLGLTITQLAALTVGFVALPFVIKGISMAVDALIVTADESRDHLASLKDEFSNNETQLETLNDELESTDGRIEELQSKGTLTFVEQEELTQLRAQNAELKRSIDLLNLQQQIKRGEINSTFVDTMRKDLTWIGSIGDGFGNDTTNIEQQFQKYEQLQRHLADLEAQHQVDLAKARESGNEAYIKSIDDWYETAKNETESQMQSILNYLSTKNNEFSTAMEGVFYIENPDGAVEESVNKYLDFIYDFQDRLAIASGGDNAKSNAFNRLIDHQFSDETQQLKKLGKEGKVTAEMLDDPAYDEFIQKCISLGIVSDSSTQSLAFLALGFNSLRPAAEGTVAGIAGTAIALVDINSKIDDAQSKIGSLSKALTSLRDGSLTLEEVIDLIQQFPELAEYVDLSAEGFGNLDEGLERLIRNSPEDVIEELQKLKESSDLTDKQAAAIDGLCDSLNKMSTDAIQDASGQFGVLADAINAAKTAKNELDKALQEEDYDAGYEARVSAFTGMQEVMNAGEYGSKAYAAYKEYFGLADKSAADVQAWMNANKQYFTEGTAGVTAFLKKIEELNKAGKLSEDIAFYDSATGELRYDINYLEEFANSLDWSEEMLQDFIDKYRMYCEDWTERTTEMTRHELFNNNLAINVDDGQAIASLEQLMAYTHMSKDDVIALVNEINQLYNDSVSELRELGEGGNVDLTMRPTVDTSVLADAGWDVAAGESATVFTSTFANKAGTVAINFTPIIVDENGNHVGTLSEDELTSYAEGIIDGTHDDYLKLQIGSVFEGGDAIAQAEAHAERIHELHELMLDGGEIKLIGVDQIQVTQQMINNLDAAKESADEVRAAIVDLSKSEGVTFDAGITYKGQTVEEIIAQAKDNSGVVSVDVKMNVNDEEVVQTITTTAATIESILGKGWEAKINSKVAEDRFVALQTLANKLVEGDYTVTVGENTTAASTALNDLSALLDQIIAKSQITVTVSGDENIQSNATGTRHADPGLSLLGDEYSATGAPKPELVVTKDHAYIAGANGPEIGYLNAGDVVYTADQTKKILGGAHGSVKRIIPRFAFGLDPWESSAYGAGTAGAKDRYTYTYGDAGGKPEKPDLPHNKDGNKDGGGKGKDPAKDIKKTFEELYKEHQHLVAMEKETDAEYLAWLEKAYQDAYKAGEISLDDYRKYAEEVYELQKELFQDSLGDIEHQISILERESGTEAQIIELYLQMIKMIEDEMQAARDRGLDDNSDYIQELMDQLFSYQDAIEEIQSEMTDNAKSAVEDLVDYRIDMIKQELENEIDALEDRKDALRDFYDEQKEMLQDYIDEEEYLEEQSEKQKAKSDIEEELARLEFDNSAWAQKRKLELQEELAEAEKDLSDFEKDHAREDLMDLMDDLYERQEAQLDAEIEAIEAQLNDPEALYNRALQDIQNNTLALYEEMVEYNNRYGSGNPEDIKEMWDSAKASLDEFLALFGEAYKDIILVASTELGDGYATGTSNASPGIHAIDEEGDEYIFQSADGARYRMFSGGEKVLNAKATDFLYEFATTGGTVLGNMVDNFMRSMNVGNITPAAQAFQMATGDIVIQGNADQHTVSEIRRAQRENIDHILKEFKRMNR